MKLRKRYLMPQAPAVPIVFEAYDIKPLNINKLHPGMPIALKSTNFYPIASCYFLLYATEGFTSVLYRLEFERWNKLRLV
jgi:hypothetical protein